MSLLERRGILNTEELILTRNPSLRNIHYGQSRENSLADSMKNLSPSVGGVDGVFHQVRDAPEVAAKKSRRRRRRRKSTVTEEAPESHQFKPVPIAEDENEPDPVTALSIVKRSKLMRGFEKEVLDSLAAACARDVHDYKKGDVVLTEGAPSDSLLLIGYGEISISRVVDGEKQIVNSLGVGDSIGELGVMTGEQRSASGTVVSDEAQLLKVSKQNFQTLMVDFPDSLFAMLREITTRLRAETVLSQSGLFRDLDANQSAIDIDPEGTLSDADLKNAALRNCPLLRDSSLINDEEFKLISSAFALKRMEPGQMVLREGAQAQTLFVVVQGDFEFLMRTDAQASKVRHDLSNPIARAPEVIGAMPFITGGNYPATVVCTETTKHAGLIARLTYKKFQQLVFSHPDIGLKFASRIVSLWKQSMALIHSALEFESAESGTLLYAEKSVADCFFVIVSGSVRLFRENTMGENQVIGDKGRLDFLGGAALLANTTHSESAMVLRHTNYVRFSREAFMKIKSESPQFIDALTQSIIARLPQTETESFGRGIKTSLNRRVIAFVPVCDIQLTDLENLVFDEVQNYGDSYLLTSFMAENHKIGFDSARGDDDSNTVAAYQAYIVDNELSNDLLILIADRELTLWTKAVVANADVIVYIGGDMLGKEPKSSIPLTPVEEYIQGDDTLNALKEFALIYAGGKKPYRRMTTWIEGRRVNNLHTVCYRDRASVARLVRMVTGHGIGLVMSGQGAQSHAHIGVYWAAKKAGLPVDLIIGTNVGAVAGVLCAMCDSYEETVKLADQVFAPFADADNELGIDVTAFASRLKQILGTKNQEPAREGWQPLKLEDLDTPVFGVVADLVNMDEIVIDSGYLWFFARVNLSMPGILPPLINGGKVLVDGSALNRTPVDMMKEFGVRQVIVSAFEEGLDNQHYRQHISLSRPASRATSSPSPSKKKQPVGCFGGSKKKTNSSPAAETEADGASGRMAHQFGYSALALQLRRLSELSGRRAHNVNVGKGDMVLTIPTTPNPWLSAFADVALYAKEGLDFASDGFKDFAYDAEIGLCQRPAAAAVERDDE